MDKDSIIEELIQTISTYHSWGWSPATSTNYSFVDETSKICKYSFEKKILFAEKSFQLPGNSEVEVNILNENEVLNGVNFRGTKVLYYVNVRN